MAKKFSLSVRQGATHLQVTPEVFEMMAQTGPADWDLFSPEKVCRLDSAAFKTQLERGGHVLVFTLEGQFQYHFALKDEGVLESGKFFALNLIVSKVENIDCLLVAESWR